LDITDRLKKIKLLLLDVDGVLTTGDIVYTDAGEQIKTFNVKDGLGIRMLRAAAIEVGVITGRKSDALRHRCKNLNIDLLFDGVRDKIGTMEALAEKTATTTDRIAFMGDDLVDLAVMRKAGLAVAVADAHPLIRETAHLTTQASGGKGAVRELCEALLHAQGKWDTVVRQLFGG
jgi:3-deoxy-D-manno-octulosonate 8-phosphate phosphatase (KDO 8-P phosphatase)